MKLNQLINKYKKEFQYFHEKDMNKRFDDFMRDLINTSESNWDIYSIRYDTVMDNKQWNDFVNNPERIPYKTKIKSLPNNYESFYEFIKKFLKDSFVYYKSIEEGPIKQNLRSNIATLLHCALNARYDTQAMRLGDLYVGRSDKDRDDGIVNPTEFGKNKLKFAVKEYCIINNKDFDKIYKKIMKISDGRISILSDYYYSCRIDTETRDEIRGISRVLRRDFTLDFTYMKIAWKIWKEIREIGINVENMLEIFEFSSYKITTQRLLDFLKDKNRNQEILMHMEDELPESYKRLQKQGFIERYMINHEEKNRKQYPKKLRSEKEIKKMISDCEKEIFSYLPLAQEPSPRNILLNPIHPESTNRAFQSTTNTTKNKKLNVIVMTPRSNQKDEYLPTLAHEATHALHKIILSKGEDSKVLKPGASEKMPGPVAEEFSQLVEHLFHTDKDLPYKKKYKGTEFSNFDSAFTTRFQAPYALTQLAIRKEFDDLWDSGYRDELTDDQIWEIKNKFDPQVKEWLSMGIDFRSEGITCFGLFSTYDLIDGLTYMKRYVVKADKSESCTENQDLLKSESKKEYLPMATAFVKRFGKNWIKRKQARIMLLWLLLESGRNYQTEKFGEFVMKKEITSCNEELMKIGIQEKDI
ncbi:hypothetical protein JW887_04145 [Candidatus Dojkabacteria bacterium]|nr:hypothetical protein [Candidatus Dojkabacteria bacterium]